MYGFTYGAPSLAWTARQKECIPEVSKDRILLSNIKFEQVKSETKVWAENKPNSSSHSLIFPTKQSPYAEADEAALSNNHMETFESDHMTEPVVRQQKILAYHSLPG